MLSQAVVSCFLLGAAIWALYVGSELKYEIVVILTSQYASPMLSMFLAFVCGGKWTFGSLPGAGGV